MLKSHYFMRIDWEIFREKRCLCCLNPFFPKKDGQQSGTEKHIRSHLCPQCAGKIKELTSGFCQTCGEMLPNKNTNAKHCGNCLGQTIYWDSFMFFGTYGSVLRELIIRAKFHNSKACAKFLGELLGYFFLEKNPLPSEITVIPMPLHAKRLQSRGYNQCIEILNSFVRLLRRNKCAALLRKDILIKKFHTVPQSSFGKKERQKNIKGSFAANPHSLKEIWLFDDIATTNSTLEEACKVLKQSGAEKIHVLLLAKTDRENSMQN